MDWPFSSLPRWPIYHLAPTTSEDDEPPRPPSGRPHLLLRILISFFIIFFSFLMGRMSKNLPQAGSGEALSFGTRIRLFEYNSTFAEPPSPESNAAWEALFPQHGGFFVHPSLAPNRSAVSVFHQLHCLDQLRHGYYALHQQVVERQQLAGHTHSLPHIRHCLDLLRQSLLCNADLTIEPKDDELGGVTGFGTSHRCIDWEALMTWILPYEGTDAPLETKDS